MEKTRKENPVVLTPCYSIYDKKGEVWDIPFFARGDLFAKRKFKIDCTDISLPFISKFKDDFELYRVGFFNSTTGVVKSIKEPVIIIKGTEVSENEQT